MRLHTFILILSIIVIKSSSSIITNPFKKLFTKKEKELSLIVPVSETAVMEVSFETLVNPNIDMKKFIQKFINDAYSIEHGDKGVAFKHTPRLISIDDAGMKEAYEDGRIIVAKESNGNIVGCIVYEIPPQNDKLHGEAIYFGPLAVDKTKQQTGIGKKLIDQVEAIGIKLNRKFIDISVVNHRSDIIPWYQKQGFEIIQEGAFPDLKRCSRPCFMYIMRKKI